MCNGSIVGAPRGSGAEYKTDPLSSSHTIAMRPYTLLNLFFLQSIITTVQPEVSPCAEKKFINNLPETRSLNYLGNRRPGLVIRGTPDYTNGNTGQIHGTGGFPNGGSGIIHGGNDVLISNKFTEQSGQSKNNLISQRLSNLVHKHGLGIRGGTIGSINHSQLNAGTGSPPGLSSTNSVLSAIPNSNVQTASAGGSGVGGSQATSSGGVFLHHRPHHGLHGIGASGGNLHHSHYLSHHGGIGSHFSGQGVGSTGHHHFGNGGLSSVNGGAGLLGLGQTHGQHHSGLGLLQGGSTSSLNGGTGGLLGLGQTSGYHQGGLGLNEGGSTSSVNGGTGGLLGLGQTHGYHQGGLGLFQGGSLSGSGGGGGGFGHRPHIGGLGLIHSNSGNQLSVSNNNLINVGSQATNSRPSQGHGGLLGLIQNRPGVGSGIFQSSGGGNNQIFGHNGGLGLIHSSLVGNSGASGSTHQYGGGTHFGQQGQQGTFTVHGGSLVAAPNYQSSGNGVNTVQVSNQQNLQQGGLSYAGMSSQGQLTGSNGGGGGVFYGYHRPQGVVYQVHWSQPGGYSTTGGLASGNTQSQSHQGITSGVSSESTNQNLNGNLNQGSQLQATNGYNNQLGSQYTSQGSLSNGGANQAQQGILTSNLSNSFQVQGGNQFSNNANINYAGNNSGSTGNNIYGSGVSQTQGSIEQEYNNVGGQNIGANHGISTGSTSNANAATQVQGSNGQSSSFGGGFASGSSTGVGTSQTHGTSSQSLNSQSGIHTGSNNGQFNTGNGYYSGSSGNSNTYGSGTTAQAEGSDGQFYVANGVYGTNVGNVNSLSQSTSVNLQSQGNSGSQGSTFVGENHLASNAGHMQSSAYGLGAQQSQGSGSQQYNTAGGHHTGINAGLSGNQFQNMGTASQSQGNGEQSSSVVGGYFTGTNSDSSYLTSSVSQTQGSSNHLSSTASENYISSNTGPSGTSSYGSNSQTQSEVSNAAASSISAAGGGAHSSTNSYGGSFLVASQGQPTYSQSSAWSHKQPANQPEGSLTFEGNLNVIGSQDNKNLNSGVGNIQNAVFSDEYIENDSEGQSAEAATGSATSGSSGSFVANGNISGDKQTHASGSLSSSTSLSENQQGHNSAGIESGVYHVGSAGNAATTTGQSSPSQSSTSGESISQSGNSQLQQGAQFGLSSQSSGSHGSEVALGGSSTNKETTSVQGSPGYNSGFSISTMSNSNQAESSGFSQGSSAPNLSGSTSHSGGTSQISEGSISSTSDASQSSNIVSNGNSNSGNNLAGGTGFSTTSNLYGISGSSIAANYGTSVNSQTSSSNQNGLSVNGNNELNKRPSDSSAGNSENTSGSGIYSSSNLGISGTSSQSSVDGLSLSSGVGNNVMNNLSTDSNPSHAINGNHLNQQQAGSNTDSSITGSNNFQHSQNTGGASSSLMSFGSHQNHNTEHTGNYNLNYNQGAAGGSVSNNQMYRPNVQQSASLSSGSNAHLGLQENYSSNLESSDKNGVHISGNNEGGPSQFSGSNSNNAQYTRPETSGSGVYDNEGNVGLNNKNPNTLSSSLTGNGQASGSNHGTFSSNQISGPTNQWSSGAHLSQNTQGVNSLQGNMSLHNQGQYSETNNIEQSFTSKPIYGGSSSVEAGSLDDKEQQSEAGTGDFNQPTTSSGNSQLSSSSLTSLEGNGNQIGSTSINNQEGYGSTSFVAGTGSQNQNGGNLIASGSSESASLIHTRGELHEGLGASTNKQSQGSLHLSHYANPIQYTERYIFVPEMISHNVDTSRIDGHDTDNIQHSEYAVVHTEDGSYIVKNLPPALGIGQAMQTQEGEPFQGYYIHENFQPGPHIDHMSTSFTPAHFIDNSQLSHSQAVGVNQHSSGVKGEISGHLGKQGNFQGLLSIPSRIVGVLSGVGNSLGGFVSHGINGGFQGNAEHSGEVSFEGEFNHYPLISGSIHSNFENHVSGSGSVEGSGERKLTKRKLFLEGRTA